MFDTISVDFPEDEVTTTYTGLVIKYSYSQAILNVVKTINEKLAQGDNLENILAILSLSAQMDIEFAKNGLKKLSEMTVKE